MQYKKIIVICCPGGGKSTFARSLNQITQLPLYHLDMLNWNADKTCVPKGIFIGRLYEIIGKESWIIDGNYNSTIEIRLQNCDLVFFLDYPPEVCIDGIKSRFGKQRDDIPWIETEEDEEFLKFVKSFNIESKPKMLALFEKYPQKEVITFHSRAEANNYLQQLNKKKFDI